MIALNGDFSDSAKKLTYAKLKEDQEKKMIEMEKQFNSEFGTDYYLMVMEQD